MSTTPHAASHSARLFLALWPDSAVRRALLGWREAWRWPASATLVQPEHLHLTLHFLGDVAASRLPELERGLRVPVSPFELDFGHCELWPHGIAVLRPDATPPPLMQLHDALRAALTGLALPIEPRAFRPHITLARHAQAAVPPVQGPVVRWRVQGYALVHSQPVGAGGYRVLRSYA